MATTSTTQSLTNLNVIDTPYLRVEKNCLEIKDTCIQISNISFFSTAEFEVAQVSLKTIGLICIILGVVIVSLGKFFDSFFVWCGIGVIALGIYYINKDKKQPKQVDKKQRLTIVTNSGNSYSIGFNNQEFFKEVVSVMTEIIRDPEHARGITINMGECKFMDSSSFIGTMHDWN